MELYSSNHVNMSLFPPTILRLYPNLGQLIDQQYNSARVHPYAYPQHMNEPKHILYMQYGYGEEVGDILPPQPPQHIIISPQLFPDYPYLSQLGQQFNSAWVHPYPYAYPQRYLARKR